MSCFAGLFAIDGSPISSKDASALVDAMRSRCSVYHDVIHLGSVVFAHGLYADAEKNRLGEIQRTDRGEMAAVVDAYFVDRPRLKASLGIAECSDQELIAAAYERWGGDFVHHVDGDFAFALWDPRRRTLTCGRDVLGVRPFYYAHTVQGLAFATDLHLLLDLPGVQRVINEEKIADFLMRSQPDPTETFYEGIHRLPAAHLLTASFDGIRMTQYWRPNPTFELKYDTEDDYANGFKELFLRSVAERLTTPGHAACQLSGGFDSSSITCAARHLLKSSDNSRLDTVSLVYDDVPKSDESKYIRAVADLPGITNHRIRADQASPFDSLDSQLEAFGEPPPSPNIYLAAPLYSGARDAGIDVLLDGYFGDSVVGHGTQYLTELFISLRWRDLVREIARLTYSNARGRHRVRYAVNLIQRYVYAPILRPYMRMARISMPGRLSHGSLRWLVDQDLLERTNWRVRELERCKRERGAELSVRNAQHSEIRSQEYILGFDVITQMARAYGITVRFPFADRRLLEYCLAVPSDQKYHEGWTRMYARRAMASFLPDAILNRYGKTYVHHNFFRSLLTLGGAQLESFVGDRLSAAAPYLNVDGIRRIYHRIRVGEERTEASWSLWNAVVLARWLELDKSQN